MKMAFFADSLQSFNIKKDSTMAMMVEAASRGWDIYAFCEQDIVLVEGRVIALCDHIQLSGKFDADWYSVIGSGEMLLADFDAIVVRKDPPFDIHYVTALWLLSLAEKQGARVFNTADSLLTHNEKLTVGQFPQFVKPTLVTADAERIRQFHKQYQDVILKPLIGMGGMGIFRVQADGLNLGTIIETLTDNGRQPLMAQAYIPEITGGDKRVLLINGKVVPFSLARIPKSGEIRGNLAAGGIGRTQPLSSRDMEIAETLAPVLAARGLFLVGLDIIGDWLTEVNVTSPTCFREITDQTGFNVAGLFIDELEKTLSQH